MPTSVIQIGPFTSVWAGDYASKSLLSPLLSVGTSGFTISDEVPEQYEPVADNSVQSGLRKITLNCSFYFDPTDTTIVKLARGTSYKL